MIKRRLDLSSYEVDMYSLNLKKKLENLDVIKNAKLIASYMPIKNEINVLINDKELCFPKIEGNSMDFYLPNGFTKGYFNILEPNGRKVLKEEIDVIIVPLLYFDDDNNRVGYGKGFYDKYLSDYKGIKIGVAYDFQRLEKIYAKETDIKLDLIVKGEL